MCKFSSPDKCLFEEQFINWKQLFPGEVMEFNLFPTDNLDCCIFHSKNVGWKKENSFSDFFLNYIKLSQKDESIHSMDFENIIIVGDASDTINFNGFYFTKSLKMESCVFESKLDMQNTSFKGIVDIHQSIFNGPVYFKRSKFYKRTGINKCIFRKPVYFDNSEFHSKGRDEVLSFTESVFEQQANFSDSKFLGTLADANFQLIVFQQNVYFTASKFEGRAIFDGTKFKGTADFNSVIFKNDAFFRQRTQDDKSYTEFSEVDFSKVAFNGVVKFQNTKFQGSAIFDHAAITNGLFKSILIKSDLSFENSKMELANFDGLELDSNARMIFKGISENKIFTRSVKFKVNKKKIKGIILFENIKVSWINKDQVKVLRYLEQEEKVLFDKDCEFETNMEMVTFKIKDANGNYRLFNEIFQKLANWISLFTSNIQVSMQVDISSMSTNEIKIKVVWQKEEDYKLFQKLSNYYFDCLNEKSENQITQILDEISSPEFLRYFSTQNGTDFFNLNNDLKDIIDDVVRTFARHIRNGEAVISSKVEINLPGELQEIDLYSQNLSDLIELPNNISGIGELGAKALLITIKNIQIMNLNQQKTIFSGDAKDVKITQQIQSASDNNPKTADAEPQKDKNGSKWLKRIAGLGTIVGVIIGLIKLAIQLWS